MTPVSRNKLTPEVEEKVLSTFVSELAKTTDIKEFNSLASLLLSPSEKLMLAKRMVAFVMIEKEIPDSRVAKALHLTTVTVAKLRFSYLLSKEKSEPAAKLIQNPNLITLLAPFFKDFFKGYRLPKYGK